MRLCNAQHPRTIHKIFTGPSQANHAATKKCSHVHHLTTTIVPGPRPQAPPKPKPKPPPCFDSPHQQKSFSLWASEIDPRETEQSSDLDFDGFPVQHQLR